MPKWQRPDWGENGWIHSPISYSKNAIVSQYCSDHRIARKKILKSPSQQPHSRTIQTAISMLMLNGIYVEQHKRCSYILDLLNSHILFILCKEWAISVPFVVEASQWTGSCVSLPFAAPKWLRQVQQEEQKIGHLINAARQKRFNYV